MANGQAHGLEIFQDSPVLLDSTWWGNSTASKPGRPHLTGNWKLCCLFPQRNFPMTLHAHFDMLDLILPLVSPALLGYHSMDFLHKFGV